MGLTKTARNIMFYDWLIKKGHTRKEAFKIAFKTPIKLTGK